MNDVRAMVRGGEFLKAVSGAGVVRIWEVRRACAEAWSDRETILKEDVERAEREALEFGADVAQRRAQERRADRALADAFLGGQTPLWRIVSGFRSKEDAWGMHPNERGMRLTRLIRAVERVVRYEWRAFETRRAGEGVRVGGETAAGGGCSHGQQQGAGRGTRGSLSVQQMEEEAAHFLGQTGVFDSPGEAESQGEAPDDPRVRWWDPLRTVCEQFGLAYSALSRIARETCGLSAPDLTDRVKAESVRSRMREDVKAWVLEVYQANKEELESEETGELADALWKCVQEKRGRGRWSRQSWAVKFGYSSYTRFVRASLAAYGVSPVELEREIVEEVVGEVQGRESEVQDWDKGSSTGAELEQEMDGGVEVPGSGSKGEGLGR